MIRIVIGGSSPTATDNRGDEAVFLNFCQGIRKSLPDTQITALVRHPSLTFDRLFDVKSIRNFDHSTKKASIGRWFNGFNPGDEVNHLALIRSALTEADLLVIGGSPFEGISSEEYLKGQAAYAALLATLARFLGKPYVVYALQQGPLEHAYTMELAHFVLANAELVTLREQYSFDRLEEAGMPLERTVTLADPAFGLAPCQGPDVGREILRREGLSESRAPMIGVNLRHVYWKWSDERFDEMANKIARACDMLAERLSARILFVPNQTYGVDMPQEDDRYIAEQIRSRMSNQSAVFVVRGDYPIFETLAIYSRLSMVMANRRHACAFSAIHGVPSLALVTDNHWNLLPLVESLGRAGRSVDAGLASAEEVSDEALKIWEQRDQIKRHLVDVTTQLSQLAHQHTDLIAQQLKREDSPCR
jgi:polysaccharide pyruvyl transferase WcaK-like protein